MAAQSAGQPAGVPRKVFYTYDEICIVCSTSCVVDDERREAIYEAVRVFVNNALAEWLAAPRVIDGASFKRHLALSAARHPQLWARIGRGGLLQPLARRAGQSSHAFDRSDGTTTLLNFYQVGNHPHDEGFGIEDRNRHIRELALFINVEFAHRRAGRHADGGWQIVAATPNWFGGSSGEHGSPAAPPRAVPPPVVGPNGPPPEPPKWQFRFDGTPDDPDATDPRHPKRTKLQGMVDDDRAAAAEGACSNVIVAVLDTCPPRHAVEAAAMAFPNNILLQQVVGRMDPFGQQYTYPLRLPTNPVRIDGALALPPGNFQHLAEVLVDWQGLNPPWFIALAAGNTAAVRDDTYAMPDHGLFAAGIVKDIAPTAEIHLIRVMDDAGMADLLNVVDVLSVLPSRLLRGKDHHRRLIVNLSLTFSVPTFEEMLDEWLPGDAINELARLTANDPKTLGYHLSDLYAIYVTIHRSLGDVIAWLGEKGVLVVAAAGNYNRPGAPRPVPRFPAYYDDVLDNVMGVAATDLAGRAASYSNLAEGNIPRHYSHGIATLGGDTVLEAGDKPAIEDEPDGTPDAIRGIFCAINLPFTDAPIPGATIGGGSNETGWVDWVGTSFATPIISAIAALVWERKPDLAPSKVIQRVRHLADIPVRDLNCDGIYTYQQ